MKTPTQIAAEAADNILHREYLNAPDADRAEVIDIIKAAIEKAYRQGLNEGFGKGKRAGIRDQIAAQSSEP